MDTCLYRKINGNNHLGHIMLECLKSRNPDDICQIDAATGEEETYGSVLIRTVALARSLRRAGLQPGDVMALSGRNHLNLRIPYYAALMNGLPIAGIDPFFKYDEIKRKLEILQPKISFCEHENYENYIRAAKELHLDMKVVTFYQGECSLEEFTAIYDDADGNSKEFKPLYFDIEKVFAWLASTSGSAGTAKFVAIRHGAAGLQLRHLNLPGVQEHGHMTSLNLSSVQWITSYLMLCSPPLQNIRTLQSSKITGIETYIDMINIYRPAIMCTTPLLLSRLLRHEKECDLTCFKEIYIAGSKVYKELLIQLRARVHTDTIIREIFGLTETVGSFLYSDGSTTTTSVFINNHTLEIKLMDATTGSEVVEPHKQGEMFLRGPVLFSEYYRNPEDTAEAFSEDGFYKTGDVFYRDETGNFYYVERLKMLIKYRGIQIIPAELEELIASIPGVLDVCVTGIPHAEDGERPAACVVRVPGSDITAKNIDEVVAGKLCDEKQLRGGIIFVGSLPKTPSGKVVRAEINKLVRCLEVKNLTYWKYRDPGQNFKQIQLTKPNK